MIIPDRGRRFFSGFRDAAVFLGWTAGLFLAGFLLWSLTGSLRDRATMRSVNSVFAMTGEGTRLEAPLSRPAGRSKGRLSGSWYSVRDSAGLLFVFSVMNGGIMTPYAVLLDSSGRADRIIPLSAHAERFMPAFRGGLADMFIRRVEAEYRAGEGS